LGDFARIQPKALEDDLGVGDQSAGAQLRSRVMRLFEDQCARCQLRRGLRQVQRGGKSRRAGAEDEDVVLWHIVGIGFGHTRSILHQSRLVSFSDVVFEMAPEIYREGATPAASPGECAKKNLLAV